MLRLKMIRLLLPLLALAFALPALATDTSKVTEDKGGEKKIKKVIVTRSGDKDEDVDVQVFADDDTDEEDAVTLAKDAHALQLFSAKRGFLGVELIEITPELREHFGAPKDAGVMIGRVVSDSPADKAGLKVGDILTEVEGKKIGAACDIQQKIRNKKTGENVSLELWRDGRRQNIAASVSEKEKAQIDLGELMAGPHLLFRGLPNDSERDLILRVDPERIEKMTEQIQKRLNSPEFQERLRRTQDLEQRSQEMEKKLQDMEKKLQEMEKKLKERSAALSNPDRT